jgi:hypothetical protein
MDRVSTLVLVLLLRAALLQAVEMSMSARNSNASQHTDTCESDTSQCHHLL